MAKYCYLNGNIVPEAEASVSVKDLGLLRGYAVFDFLRIQNENPIFLEAHLNRFKNSAKSLGLEIPVSRQEITEIIQDLLEKNGLKNATARLVLTGGESADGLSKDGQATFFVLMKDLPKYPAEIYENGIKLMIFEHQREKSEAKTSNYITLLSLAEAKKEKDAFEVLYTSGENVLEGATCNFFIFKGNTLITAKDNILEGTRRKAILKLAEGKFKVEIRELKIIELKEASEAFISSVTRDIVPVVQVDETKIGNGKVGENTKWLMRKLRDLITEESKEQSLVEG